MELLVLREGVHGMSPATYADTLRSKLPEHTVRLAETPDDERRLISTADIVTGPRVDESLLEHADDAKLFACAYAGHDHLPLDALASAGIAVTNAVGVHAPNVAEHAIGSILLFSRRLHEAVRADRWQPLFADELAGSVVTIVGLGTIGQAVATRLEPFDVTTLGVRRNVERGGPTDDVLPAEKLHDALARSDFVVLCCPLTDETRGLLDEAAFVTLPPDAVVVNVARGEVIETAALVDALHRGRIGGAALDVTDPEPLASDHPLWEFENVVVTPHNAGSTPQYYERLAAIVAANVERLQSDDSLRNRVS